MSRSTLVASPVGALAAAGVAAGAALAAEGPATPSAQESGRYEDLLGLFSAWRAFQKARLVAGVPDYTAAAMAGQQRELAGYERRLKALDPGRWPIPQQVDYHVVRAEMNGLEFNDRVLKPWANNPAFYVTVFSERRARRPSGRALARDRGPGPALVWRAAVPIPLTPNAPALPNLPPARRRGGSRGRAEACPAAMWRGRGGRGFSGQGLDDAFELEPGHAQRIGLDPLGLVNETAPRCPRHEPARVPSERRGLHVERPAILGHGVG